MRGFSVRTSKHLLKVSHSPLKLAPFHGRDSTSNCHRFQRQDREEEQELLLTSRRLGPHAARGFLMQRQPPVRESLLPARTLWLALGTLGGGRTSGPGRKRPTGTVIMHGWFSIFQIRLPLTQALSLMILIEWVWGRLWGAKNLQQLPRWFKCETSRPDHLGQVFQAGD